MRNVLWLSGMALAISSLGSAAPVATCGAGTLASYIALGTAGCSVNDQDFYGFVNLPVAVGSTQIAASAITVTPVTTQFMPGFLFTLNSTAAANQLFESLIGFNVTPLMGGARLGGAFLNQNGATATGAGGVIGISTICFDAQVSTAACPTPAFRNLGTQTLSGIPSTPSDSLIFGATHGLLGVTGDFSVDGGGTGSASVTSFGIQVQATPEPATLALTGLALAGLGFLRRKNSVRIG